MKKILLVLVTVLFLVSCGNSDKSAKNSENKETQKLKVAATPVPAG